MGTISFKSINGSNNGTATKAKPNPAVVLTVDPRKVTKIRNMIKFVSNDILIS